MGQKAKGRQGDQAALARRRVVDQWPWRGRAAGPSRPPQPPRDPRNRPSSAAAVAPRRAAAWPLRYRGRRGWPWGRCCCCCGCCGRLGCGCSCLLLLLLPSRLAHEACLLVLLLQLLLPLLPSRLAHEVCLLLLLPQQLLLLLQGACRCSCGCGRYSWGCGRFSSGSRRGVAVRDGGVDRSVGERFREFVDDAA